MALCLDFVFWFVLFGFIFLYTLSGKKALDAKKRSTGDALSMREDEMAMTKSRRKAKEVANQTFTDLVKASIKGSKRENMQSQDMLRAEMQNAYKHGEV